MVNGKSSVIIWKVGPGHFVWFITTNANVSLSFTGLAVTCGILCADLNHIKKEQLSAITLSREEASGSGVFHRTVGSIIWYCSFYKWALLKEFEMVWNHKGYLCGQALAGKVSSNSPEARCCGRAGAKTTLTHNQPTLAALDWDNGHPGRLGHSLCRENPIKALSFNDHAFQGMLGVSTHWFPLKISQIDCGALYCFTASLQAFSLPTTHLSNFDGRMQD